MDASILDLRYKMKEVLKALDRRETVNILYHGKIKGTIQPVKKKCDKDVTKHPIFGMYADDERSVDEIMQELRGGRYSDL